MQEKSKEIGQRLLEARKKLGLSQLEMARQANLARTYIGHVENGKQNPSFDFLMKIAGQFDISIDWLLFGRGQMEILPENHCLNHLDSEQIEFLKRLNEVPKEKQSRILKIVNDLLEL